MKTGTGSRGTIVTFDDDYKLGGTLADSGQTRRRSAEPTEDSTPTYHAALLRALEQENLDCSERFTLELPGETPARRARPREVAAPVMQVTVEPNQSAMLLIESEGVFQWVLPEEIEAPGAVRRTTAQAVLVFRLGRKVDSPDGRGRRGPLLDWAVDALIAPIRIIVVRFAARKAVEFAREWLEASVKPGSVDMSGGTESWRPVTLAPMRAPKKVLLFLHGTFSSNLGSFGALATTEAGKALLEEARKHYDAMLGYDHYTLRAIPDENAKDVLDMLLKLEPSKDTVVDIIAYSRGGLVARQLVERLLPAGGWPFKVGKLAFVACTNGGTALAKRENWKTLLDVYTNLAVAAGRGLGALFPGIADTVITEGIKTLGSFAEAVVDVAIEDAMVPGIAAMAPDGVLVRDLNKPLAEKPNANIAYYAVGSNFSALVFGGGIAQQPSLPDRLMSKLSDLFADQLMAEANDLVVNGAAMVEFGGYEPRLSGSLMWDSNPVIHHLNYFGQPSVANALHQWLMPPADQHDTLLMVADPLVLDGGETLAKVRELLAGLGGEQPVVIRQSTERYFPRTTAAILPSVLSGNSGALLSEALGLGRLIAARLLNSQIEPLPDRIGMSGLVRVVDQKVVEAILPPLTSALPGPTDPELKVTAARRGSASVIQTRKEARRSANPAPTVPYAGPPSAVELPPDVTCHFGAEMPPAITAGEPADLTVTISRQEITAGAGKIAAEGKAVVQPSESISLEVRAKDNCVIVGDSGCEVRVPEDKDFYDFKVRGLAPGPAEIWVDARQGPRRLVRLVLQPNVVHKITAAAVIDTAVTDPPMVEIRIYEEAIGAASQFRLRFLMQSQELGDDGVSIERYTEVLNGKRDAILQSFYEMLEGAWGKNPGEYARFMGRVADWGVEFYRQLVPRPIQEAIWKYRKQIGSITVISDEPFIPWEALYVVEPDRGFDPDSKFLAEHGLVRWLPDNGFPPVNLSAAPRARHVVPDYANPNFRLPHAEEERRLLTELLQSTPVTGGSDALLPLLGRGEFDLLHFGCHGHADKDSIWDAALLVGEDESDTVGVMSVNARARLKGDDGRRPIVFLNACQTGRSGQSLIGTGGMADAFVRHGAGLFVGTQWSIADSTALIFADTFYRELLAGHSVIQATLAARKVAKGEGDPTWLAYTVYGHPYARLSKRAGG